MFFKTLCFLFLSRMLLSMLSVLFMVSVGGSPRVSTPPFPGPSSLPTIVGSPTKMPAGFHFPTTAADVTNVEMKDAVPVGSVPLQTPFAACRNKTCPDNIAATGYTPDGEFINILFLTLCIDYVFFGRLIGGNSLVVRN